MVLAVVTLVLVFRKPRLPPCSLTELAVARQRWADARLEDYDLEVEVRGKQAAVYAVEVREGEVRAATRNREPLKSPRTLGTWSVPGMFATLEADAQNQRRLEAGEATADIPWVDLRAEFEPTWGYPLRCQRIQWGGPGVNPEVFWEVRSFQRRAPE